MNEERLVALIERDRGTPLPEGPDPRWIAARVQVEIGVSSVRTETGSDTHLLIGLAVIGVAAPSAWALYTHRPELLLCWPVLLLFFTPLLTRKGATR